MGCKNDLGDISLCSVPKNDSVNMENAGIMVGIDLTSPIDLSQMGVSQIESQAIFDQDDAKMKVNRKSVLHAFVFNDEGEREELTVTFELISNRLPKLIRKL